MNTARMHCYVSGEVQHVGFRWRAQRIAGELDITGWVRNLYDGRVELEAQGSPEALDQFLPAIERAGRSIEIDRVDRTDIPVRPDEYGFTVRRGS